MRKVLFTIAILGLLVSGYLFIEYVTGGPIVCGKWGSCEAVRASAYAYLLGLPTPAYGLIFYSVLALGAILTTPTTAARLRLPLRLLTVIGVGTSIWLTYIEAFVIHAWCIWCVASAVLTVLAFVVVWTSHTPPQVTAASIPE